MKRYIFHAFLLLFSIQQSFSLDQIFTFTNNKDEHGTLSHDFLRKITQVFHAKNFIETGTYSGNTALRSASFFEHVYTSELHPTIFNNAQQRLKKNSNISIYQGESGDVLRTILPAIGSAIIFWLDAHYCGENTGWGKNVTAVTDEVDAIKTSNIDNYMILIDDIRGFGTKINDTEFICCKGYPSIQELGEQLWSINENFAIKLIGDTLMVYDATKYNPEFSPMVHACSVSRMLIGYSDAQIIEAEEIIAQATGAEKEFISWYYRDQNHYNTDQFHHYLWYALTQEHNKEYDTAYAEFQKIIEHGYTHWRIYWYAARCSAAKGDINRAKAMIAKAHDLNPTFAPIGGLMRDLAKRK